MFKLKFGSIQLYKMIYSVLGLFKISFGRVIVSFKTLLAFRLYFNHILDHF